MNFQARQPGQSEQNGLRRCEARTLSGEPCKCLALPGDSRCWSHSPRHAEALRAGRRRGGLVAARRAKAGNLEGLNLGEPETCLAAIASALVRGGIGPDHARELRSLVKARIEAVDVKALSERLDKLEGKRK